MVYTLCLWYGISWGSVLEPVLFNKFPGVQWAKHCMLAVMKANGALYCINRKIASWFKEVIISLKLVLIRPHLEYYIQFWVHPDKTECSSKWNEFCGELPSWSEYYMPCEETLRKQGLFNLKKKNKQTNDNNKNTCLGRAILRKFWNNIFLASEYYLLPPKWVHLFQCIRWDWYIEKI